MTSSEIIATAKLVKHYGDLAVQYIKDDQNARLGLIEPVGMQITGPGVGIGNFESEDGLFTMTSPSPDVVELSFRPFPADDKTPWNGPDGVGNFWSPGLRSGSLPHDLITLNVEQIAEKLGMTVTEVWGWASGVLAVVSQHYGKYKVVDSVVSWAAYYVTRAVRRPYRWIKKHLGFLIVAAFLVGAAAGCSSCMPTPMREWKVTRADPIISVENGVIYTNTPPVINAD